jgi:hypothetical protein
VFHEDAEVMTCAEHLVSIHFYIFPHFLAEIIPSLQAKHLQTISLRLNEMPTFSHEAMWRNLDNVLTLSPVIGVDIGLPKETMDSDNERVKDAFGNTF